MSIITGYSAMLAGAPPPREINRTLRASAASCFQGLWSEHEHILIHMHAHTHTHAGMHARMHAHMHARTHIHTHTHAHTQAHTHMHTHTHTYTHTHTQKQSNKAKVNTHTHLNTCACKVSRWEKDWHWFPDREVSKPGPTPSQVLVQITHTICNKWWKY